MNIENSFEKRERQPLEIKEKLTTVEKRERDDGYSGACTLEVVNGDETLELTIGLSHGHKPWLENSKKRELQHFSQDDSFIDKVEKFAI